METQRSTTYDMIQREILLRKFLQPNNDMLTGSIHPRTRRHERSARALVLGVVEDTQGRPLDVDGVAAFVHEFAGNGGRDGGAVLERFRLAADVEDGGRHAWEGNVTEKGRIGAWNDCLFDFDQGIDVQNSLDVTGDR